MKALTLRLTADEIDKLNRLKALGFSTAAEVIKCASLSLCDAKLPPSASPVPR